MNSLVVATECPSCGAPLDFTEGSNAVACQHCRSNLLVTGRKQVLSYYIPPRLEERRAVAMAVMAQRNRGRSDLRGIKQQLYFLPYYRMTGQDFGWEKAPPKQIPAEEGYLEGDEKTGSLDWIMEEPDSFSLFKDASSLFDAAGDLVSFLFRKAAGNHTPPPSPEPARTGEIPPKQPDAPHPEKGESENNVRLTRGSLYEKGDVLLNDRYIEKNFLACDLQGVGLYSLGVRPAVLRVELFNSETLKPLGKVVSPSVSPETAESIGLRTALDPSRLYRQVIGKILSVIYFPFWVVETQSGDKTLLTIIDAVSQAVIEKDASPSLYKILDRPLQTEPKIIGFRPLTCPNCGWDLPMRPDDSIFFCGSCNRAWQICGSDLCEIAYRVAHVQTGENNDQVKYLPFWIFHSGGEQSPRFFVPSFRYRRLKFLLDLALRLSRIQPELAFLDPMKEVELFGCYYDSEDAALLARFTNLMLSSEKVGEFSSTQGEKPSLPDATLIWLPFRIQGQYLFSPFGSINIPKNLLV
jgi:DNA-directed RNA polymerase subunit RPC12/RpoP